jgi:hypothetical protein
LIGAEEAYLLYQDVPFIIQRGDLLRGSNGGHAPAELMGGYYRLLARDPQDNDLIYARTERDSSEYRQNPRLFFENLAHPAYDDHVQVNRQAIAADEVAEALPFLRESTGAVTLDSVYELDVRFGREDVEVSELDITRIHSHRRPVTVSLDLFSAAGTPLDQTTFDVDANLARGYFHRLASPVRAARLVMRISVAGGEPTRVSITDLRVQGQTQELARYIRKALTF